MIEELERISSRINESCDSVSSEEHTKTALVLPFIQALGYDTSNPGEFIPEYLADLSMRGDCVDYVISLCGKPAIIIECKRCDKNLTHEHVCQLRKYFSPLISARLGILTNGIEYRFFTDSQDQNVMDSEPFMTFNLKNIDSVPFVALQYFTKQNYSQMVLKRIRAIKSLKKQSIS